MWVGDGLYRQEVRGFIRIMAMPLDLYNQFSLNPPVAWYPFSELPAITSGYTPNVSNQADGGDLGLSLTSFQAGDSVGNGVFISLDGKTGYLRSGAKSSLQITDDLTILMWHKRIDKADDTWLMMCRQDTEVQADNITYSIKRYTATGSLAFLHEYGSGVNVETDLGVIFPDDGSNHFLCVRRDTTAKNFSTRLDSSSFNTSANYSNNPDGGSNSDLQITIQFTGSATAQDDGEYSNVLIFDSLLSNDEVEVIYNSGLPSSDWFNYSNWDSVSGTGYVLWNKKRNIIIGPF